MSVPVIITGPETLRCCREMTAVAEQLRVASKVEAPATARSALPPALAPRSGCRTPRASWRFPASLISTPATAPARAHPQNTCSPILPTPLPTGWVPPHPPPGWPTQVLRPRDRRLHPQRATHAGGCTCIHTSEAYTTRLSTVLSLRAFSALYVRCGSLSLPALSSLASFGGSISAPAHPPVCPLARPPKGVPARGCGRAVGPHGPWGHSSGG